MVDTRSATMKKKIAEAKPNVQTWSNLPFDLTLLILQRLSLKDNIRASSVCKTWHRYLVSVRVEDPTPWVMFPPFYRDKYELYDPSLGKTHLVNFPHLRGTEVCYSRDGWLLMRERNLTGNFFFNPFTQERIEVAWPDLWRNDAIAFSCAPTSSSCVLFSVCGITTTSISIQTYRPTSKKRAPLKILPNTLPVTHKGFEHVVFSNGVFYCLTKLGCLGMFDLSTNSWSVLLRPPPERRETNDDGERFMTEYQGDIYLVYTHGQHRKPTYLKLDLTNRKWTVKRGLPGLMFYLGLQSAVTTNREVVDIPRLNQQRSDCIVWIKTPINVSNLFNS